MTERGLFIVLEGIDDCGKTTQTELLAQYLTEKGLSVVQTREPGGTEVGEEIRQVLLKPRPAMMDPVAQTLLFYAARMEFLRQAVKPHLQQGVHVITDRFAASTYVYQGHTQGVEGNLLETLYRHIVIGSECEPDLSVVVDITAEESRKRDGNADRANQQHIFEEWLDREKLRQGYLEYARINKVPIIDGMRTVEIVHQDIVKLVEEKLR